MNAIPESGGIARKKLCRASTPPAEAPMPTVSGPLFRAKRDRLDRNRQFCAGLIQLAAAAQGLQEGSTRLRTRRLASFQPMLKPRPRARVKTDSKVFET